MKQFYLKTLFSIILVGVLGIANAQTIRYVKPTASGAGTGASWTDASASLQAMITASASGDEIWVAAGTYLPTTRTNVSNGTGTSGTRDNNFALAAGVKIYGGFSGTETLRSQRNVATNISILSGNLTDQTLSSDNAYHIVVGLGNLDGAVLDGFTITGGNGSSTFNMVISTYTINRNNGSAIYLREAGSSLILNNLIINNNTTAGSGGAMYCHSSSPNITNVTFSNNSTTGSFSGGALFLFGSAAVSNPTLTNVTFSNNSAGNQGGSIYVSSLSNPVLNTVTFTNNSSTDSGGAMFIATSASLTNVTFTGNSSGSGNAAGALYISGSTASSLTNVTFDTNTSGSSGGAIYIINSNPTFTNVTFKNNTSTTSGGAVYIYSSTIITTPTFRNVSFIGNTSGSSGGALFTFGNVTGFPSSPVLTNALFYNNTANSTIGTAGGGGAIYVSNTSNVTISGATFFKNDSKFDGGAIITAFTSSVMNLYNSIVYGNTAINATKDIQNGGTGNFTLKNSITQLFGTNGVSGNKVGVDPLFSSIVDTDPSFLRLSANSPAINAGDNSLLTAGVTTDFLGNMRVFDTTIDMGIYEYQSTLPVNLKGFTAKAQKANAVLSWTTLSETNNDYFTLEHSTDGISFGLLTKVYAKGAGEYVYTDNTASQGVNYYKLTQVDKNGQATDYGIKSVNIIALQAADIVVYPNPAANYINISLNGANYTTAKIIDTKGGVTAIKALVSDVTKLDLSELPKGVYLISISGNAGTVVKKFIKL